jgi:hypothetical protein
MRSWGPQANEFGVPLGAIPTVRPPTSALPEDPWMRDVATMMIGWLVATALAITALPVLGPMFV